MLLLRQHKVTHLLVYSFWGGFQLPQTADNRKSAICVRELADQARKWDERQYQWEILYNVLDR